MSDRFAESMGGRSKLSVSRSPEKDAAPGKLSSSSINARSTKAMPDLSAYRYTGVGASKPAPAPLPFKRPLERPAAAAASDGSDSEGFEVTGSSSADAPVVKKRRFFKASERSPRNDDESQDSSLPSASSKPPAAPATPAAAGGATKPSRETRATRIMKLLEREDRMLFTHEQVCQALESASDDVKRAVLQLKRQWNESHREEVSIISDTSDGPTGSSSILTGSTAASSAMPSPRDVSKAYPKKLTATTSYARPQTISPSLSPALPGRTFQIASSKPAAVEKAQVAVSKALATGSKPVVHKRAISVSDDDGASASDGGYDSDGLAQRMSTAATSWFSTCDKDALIETTGCTDHQADIIIGLRPFRNASDVQNKLASTKGVTARLFTDCEEVMAHYHAVDSVLSKCERKGEELRKETASWDQEKPTSEGYLHEQPEGLAEGVVLKDFQLRGVNWLKMLHRKRVGGILADEMGTGKTVQVIAFLTDELAQTGPPRTHLIVVPSSVLNNWEREFETFAPHIPIMTYHGTQKERAELRYDLKDDRDSGGEREYQVVLATYESVIGAQDYNALRKFGFKICVFDEGHLLKNKLSQKYEKLIRIQNEWRLLLTGTPLQNNLGELMSLLNFIMERFFASSQDALDAIFKKTASKPQNLLSRQRVGRAKRMLQPFVLRRKKLQVLPDLPSKTERAEICDMTPAQRRHYDETFARSKAARMEAAARDSPDTTKPVRGQGKGAKGARDPSFVLMELRKAANHALNFRNFYDDKKLDKLAIEYVKDNSNEQLSHVREDLAINSDAELCLKTVHSLPRLRGSDLDLPDEAWLDSGKMRAMQRIIEAAAAKGERVLIFSQFVEMLHIICQALDVMGVSWLGFTGSTKVGDRQHLVDEFTDDSSIQVFLLSTGAGGVGINLTAANHVILYDQNYNPQNDRQAEDRCWRIGQERPVTVYRLVSRDSIDEQILALGAKKLQLASSVEGEDEEADGDAKEAEIRAELMQELYKTTSKATAAQTTES